MDISSPGWGNKVFDGLLPRAKEPFFKESMECYRVAHLRDIERAEQLGVGSDNGDDDEMCMACF